MLTSMQTPFNVFAFDVRVRLISPTNPEEHGTVYRYPLSRICLDCRLTVCADFMFAQR